MLNSTPRSQALRAHPIDYKNYSADIFLVGLGIFGLRQVTAEALDVMKSVRRVCHISPYQSALQQINPNTDDLSPRYWKPGDAWDIYTGIARYVVRMAAKASPIAFAVEGNPMVFNDISWEIARLGRKNGIRVQALPGISCLDILPIQLGFDIGDLGTQIFEATQLVRFGLEVNPFLSSLILQIAEFGASTILLSKLGRGSALGPLVSHLCKFFPPNHLVILIRSPSSPGDPSVVVAKKLNSIENCRTQIESGMTLYIPRIGIPAVKNQIGRGKKSGLAISKRRVNRG